MKQLTTYNRAAAYLNSIFDLLNDNAFLIVLGCALTIVMIGGGINISVGGVVCLTVMAGALFLNNPGIENDTLSIIVTLLIALGIGLADITTKGLVDRIDRESMYSNLIPTTYLERGKIPPYFDTEEDALDVAMRVYGHGADTSLIIADNTLQIETLLVSEKVLREHPELEVLEEGLEITFDTEGRLCL